MVKTILVKFMHYLAFDFSAAFCDPLWIKQIKVNMKVSIIRNVVVFVLVIARLVNLSRQCEVFCSQHVRKPGSGRTPIPLHSGNVTFIVAVKSVEISRF